MRNSAFHGQLNLVEQYSITLVQNEFNYTNLVSSTVVKKGPIFFINYLHY